MKKILMFSSVIILAFVLCLSSSAGFLDDLFPNGEYPDDVGAYYYGRTGYNPETPDIKPHNFYIVYMVEGTSEERLEQIRSYLGEGETVEFRYCKRSYNFYSDLSKRIGNEFKTDKGNITSICVGIGDSTFLLVYVTGNEDLIQAEIDAAYPEFKDEIRVKYYDVTSGIDEVAYDEVLYRDPVGASDKSSNVIWFIALAVVVLVGAGLVTIVLVTRRKRVLVTSDGEEITEGGMSARKVEDAVAVGQEPSDEVYEEIKKKI